MSDFTIENLRNVEDLAPKFGFGELGEARFAHEALEAQDTGVAYHRLKANKRQGFGHRHENAEEIYVVVRGSGRVRLDDEERELSEFDALRVAPKVMRRFEAGPDGLDLLVFGPRHKGDGEMDPGFWAPEG